LHACTWPGEGSEFLKGAAIFVAPFPYRRRRPVMSPSRQVLGNDLHKNKEPKRAATCFRRPQNFLLPMTLK
ncbi:hypothetical protein, partial [Mesorhizobium sp.]|uniref:hypothetical protein n=1 Tax=Mesorhizobium sp. TaxID=1871066 RepID=UPI0025B80B95